MNLTFLYLTTWYFNFEDSSGIVNLFFHLFPDIFIDLANHVIIVKGIVNTFKKWMEYKYEKFIFDK